MTLVKLIGADLEISIVDWLILAKDDLDNPSQHILDRTIVAIKMDTEKQAEALLRASIRADCKWIMVLIGTWQEKSAMHEDIQ
jgi:hypothetical protein